MTTAAATITNDQIEALRTAAAQAGDLAQVAICDIALRESREPRDYTISTAKGSHTGPLLTIVRWQCEHQGAAADIDGWSVDHLDFDGDDEDAFQSTRIAVRAAARAECARVIADAE